MIRTRNPGREAGLIYLLLVLFGPLRLVVIPARLYADDPGTTFRNIAAHQWLFRCGMLSDLAAAMTLIFLVLALHRLFRSVDRTLTVLVIIFGGIMPSLLSLVNVASDATVLAIVRGAPFLAAFDQPQREAIAAIFLRLHDKQNSVAELLWGLWLIPLAMLIWRCGFLPRFLSVWLSLNGVAYILLCLASIVAPQWQHAAFLYAQPALLGELALTFWLIARGGHPLVADSTHITTPTHRPPPAPAP